jgi:hypothetical protein
MISSLDDLKIAYRDLRPQAKDSKLTVSIRGALDIIEFHLIEGIEYEEDSDSDESAESVETGADPAQRDADEGNDGLREDNDDSEAGSSDGRPSGDGRETEPSSD